MLPISLGEYNVPLIISWICVFMCLLTLHFNYRPSKQVRNLLIIITIILVVEVINQTFFLGYGFDENLKVIIPYLYCYLSVPICYYIERKGIIKLLDRISFLSFAIVLIKSIGWILYSKFGITILSNLILKYSSEWARNGSLRVEVDCLFGLSFCYFLFKAFSSRKKINYLIVCIYIAYAWIIAQSRTIFLALIICTVAMFYFNGKKGQTKILIRFVIALLLLAFLMSDSFINLISSFSTSNLVYGGSSIARFDCILHYWKLMVARKSVFGLGLLDTSCPHAISLMDNTHFSIGNWYSFYYLADIGILGGFFRFGVLSFLLYGYLIYIAVKAVLNALKKVDSMTPFFVGIFMCFVVDCFILNSFEMTRAFGLVFYICIFNHSINNYNFNNISKKGN